MKIQYDVWLDNDGKAFGEECFRLLEAVEKAGSLNRAATEVGLSYGAALRTLKKSEERLGFALLERRIGGASGGGSRLTPLAMELMARYKLFSEEIPGIICRIYGRHFGTNKQLVSPLNKA
jgi:molybdate transport system regulatory protein